MLKNSYKIAFTLVEVLVSITIFSIIIVSIMSIYFISTEITMKSDINRILQENIKSVSNAIAEDIRKNWVTWVKKSIIDICDIELDSNLYKTWTELCTQSWNIYYLWKLDLLSSQYIRVDESECDEITDKCVIARWPNEPLTNSYVTVKKLDFYVSKDYIPKVTMNITMQPSIDKWVKPDLIKESKIIFQTTISERPF